MDKVLIERNASHIDVEDMAARVAIFDSLGVEASLTEQTILIKASWWVLILR